MKIKDYIKPYRLQFGVGFFAKLFEALLELYLPILMAVILDQGILQQDKSLILKTGGKMLLFAVLGYGCAALAQYSAAVTSQKIGTDMRYQIKRHISRFSFRELDTLPTSTLINRITTDVNNVQYAVSMTVRLASRAPFIGIGAVIMSYTIDPKLTLIFIAMIPLVSLIVYAFMHVTSPMYSVVQGKLDNFTEKIRETLSGVRVIRAFAHETEQEEKGAEAADQVAKTNIRVAEISAWMQPVSAVIINFGILLILYFGARRVSNGRLAQGDILALTIYANKILYAISSTAGLIVIFTKASASTKRLREVLETEPTLTYPALAAPLEPNCKEVVSFREVCFGYSKEVPALKAISLSLSQGETLGIVGVTGAGKTTLVQLLQRHYDPDQGEISFLCQPISTLSEVQLREKIGIVPQKNVLFSGTIADNLRMSAPNASKEDIIAALKTAQCWEFVSSLADGIETQIFEGGKNFSGGQRQRLAIARGIVGKPSVLILDDSLSALDYKTDLALRDALNRDLPHLAKVIVSQRISSVLSADHICVLEGGEITAEGTHQELIKTSPVYQDIYQSQAQEEVSA